MSLYFSCILFSSVFFLNRRLYFKSLLCMNNFFYYFNNYLRSFFTENICFITNYDSTLYILILLNLFTNSYRSVKFIKSDYKFIQEQKSFVVTIMNYKRLRIKT